VQGEYLLQGAAWDVVLSVDRLFAMTLVIVCINANLECALESVIKIEGLLEATQHRTLQRGDRNKEKKVTKSFSFTSN
jgi:hypothetical protein